MPIPVLHRKDGATATRGLKRMSWRGMNRLNDMLKALKQHRFGFSLYALLVFVLQELPYLPWAIWPPRENPLAGNAAAYPWLEITEKAAGILTLALLILLIRKDGEKPSFKNRFFTLAAICLAGYYASWIAYFSGVTSGWLIVIGLTALVPVYYLFVALWLKNRLAVIPCAAFIVAHTTVNVMNFLL